ncbi:hypothetical protein HNQ07_004231 [Deinococcus metalli]|uniref:Uncharacterized protein n=1 Tax=Deinococcus metalli TaxID=1141878 RepID=A0A7W8NQ67_9DEIO|nr:hypothetical protein [Deinococcus metalli]MBB5378724.1 hypothetical protein [Deinococcus metalli]GHF60409.1 hypothetical protein GCM10017781_40740 [Deinococcus metalli]
MPPLRFHPLLILAVPACHEVDPHAWHELRRHISVEYGAALLAEGSTEFDTLPVLLGDWGRHEARDVLHDLAPFLARAFFTLDWLEEVI